MQLHSDILCDQYVQKFQILFLAMFTHKMKFDQSGFISASSVTGQNVIFFFFYILHLKGRVSYFNF